MARVYQVGDRFVLQGGPFVPAPGRVLVVQTVTVTIATAA
jgi:hypothetical protein